MHDIRQINQSLFMLELYHDKGIADWCFLFCTSCFKINAFTVGVHNFTAQFAFDLEIVHLLRLIWFLSCEHRKVRITLILTLKCVYVR